MHTQKFAIVQSQYLEGKMDKIAKNRLGLCTCQAKVLQRTQAFLSFFLSFCKRNWSSLVRFQMCPCAPTCSLGDTGKEKMGNKNEINEHLLP